MLQKHTHQETEEGIKNREEFASLLNATFSEKILKEGEIIQGRIVRVSDNFVVVDVNLKSEGFIPVEEFQDRNLPEVGDFLDVFLERIEGSSGGIVLSFEKAKRKEVWRKMEASLEKKEQIEGEIFSRVRGGFTVDLGGIVAFLPGSQVDVRPVHDMSQLMHTPHKFLILKMDEQRESVVVSRRAILEEERAGGRAEILNKLEEGQIIEGTVKNITDYGAFVDLGGIDGLLHITDMSWTRVSHPSDMLEVDKPVKVRIIKINSQTQRVSLGMKQLETDPWVGSVEKYKEGEKFTRKVTSLADYGAFIELEKGIEGLVHVSEMSWTKRNVSPSSILTVGDDVEVVVLGVDSERRRVSLGIKQCLENPWEAFANNHKVGDVIEGCVENITPFGLFVRVDGGIDAIVHISHLDWDLSGEEAIKQYTEKDQVKAVILEMDPSRERIALSIKKLSDGEKKKKKENEFGDLIKGKIITCVVKAIRDDGISVTLLDREGIEGFIRRSELSRSRSEQHPDRFGVEDRIDAKIIQFDRSQKRVLLSIKALEISEEKEAIAQYGSSDAGASLGDILGIALSQAQEKEANTKKEQKESKQKASKANSKDAAPKDSEDKKTDAKKADVKEVETKKTDTKKAESKVEAKESKFEEESKADETTTKGADASSKEPTA